MQNRLRNFTVAAIRHLLNGLPTCSQEQIDERLAICYRCEYFQPEDDNRAVGICMHGNCGCNLSTEEKFLNKLAWADQRCPDGRWAALLPRTD